MFPWSMRPATSSIAQGGRASPAASRPPSRSTRAIRRGTSPSSRPISVPLLASVDADDNAISFFASRSTGFVLVGQAHHRFRARADPVGRPGRQRPDRFDRPQRRRRHDLGVPRRWTRLVPPARSICRSGSAPRTCRWPISSRTAGSTSSIPTGSRARSASWRTWEGELSLRPCSIAPAQGRTASPGRLTHPRSRAWREPSSVAVGTFTTGGLPSLVALDPGSNTFGLLSGLGGGRLSNPTYFPTPATGLVVRAIDFNGDGLTGLAILSPDGLFIYRSDGQGGFLPPTELNVGFEPNGLTVADLNGDGKADLLVSNPLGDVLVLIGNGDGTFQPVQNLDQQVVAGGLRPQRNHAGRVHLRRSAHGSARRPNRRRR